ncbi:MAG: hypothetical protein RBU29_01855 [bacterium]|jgi:hypothetical protein|nr:hypothetical protein [bacterium]
MNTTVDELIKLKLFSPNHVPSPLLLLILGLILLLVTVIFGFHYWQQRAKREQDFHTEMASMAMSHGECAVLSDLVQRYTLGKPVEILYSLPLFDELLEKEMERVMVLPLSSEAKKQYVDLLYQIRQKAFFNETPCELSPAPPEGNHSDTPPLVS